MLWGLFALAAGLTYCGQAEINKHYKLCGFQLNTVRSLFAFLFLIPLIPFMEWPSYYEYYIAVLLEASISVVCMMAQYNLAAKRNGRIACLHQPIAIVVTFILWLGWGNSQLTFLMNNKDNLGAILIGFLVFIVSIQFMRKNDAGWSALLSVLPIAVLYSIMSVISKIALEHGESLLQISLNFVFLCNLFMFLLSLPVYQKKKEAILNKKTLYIGSFYISFFHTVSWILCCIAIILTPNPAYVAVITGLAPIWFMIYYKLKNIPDDSSPVAGLFMSIAAIIVLLATNN